MFNHPDNSPFTLLYNNSVPVVSSLKNTDDISSVPLEEKEDIVFEGRYKNRIGVIVTITRALDQTSLEYPHGYRFMSDNHLYYRADGTTYGKDFPQHDDLIEKVV